MKWTEKYKINTHDTDFNEVLSPSGFMRYIQDTANCQMEGQRPSYSELFHSGYAFVITRLNARIYTALRSHEEICCSSWACESKGLSFNRCYEIYKGSQKIAEASSVWALLNTKTGKLCRCGEIELSYYMDEPVLSDMPQRLRLPADIEMNPAGDYKVHYGDVDMNRHLNNSRYPDMLFGAIPTYYIDGKYPAEISISFIHEAPLGDNLNLFTGTSDKTTHYVRSIRSDGQVNAEARFVLKDISANLC